MKKLFIYFLGFVTTHWDNISWLGDHVYCFYCKSINNAQTYQEKQMLHLQKMSSLFKYFIQLSSHVQHKNWVYFLLTLDKRVGRKKDNLFRMQYWNTAVVLMQYRNNTILLNITYKNNYRCIYSNNMWPIYLEPYNTFKI